MLNIEQKMVILIKTNEPLYKVNERYRVIYDDKTENSKIRLVYLTLKYIEEYILHFCFDDGTILLINKKDIITIKPAPKPNNKQKEDNDEH